MSDEEQDTTVQTDDSVTQETVDWQKRFTDTQAEYTRSQQALKDAESVWEDRDALIARIAEKHPDMIADEDETVEDDDSSYEEDEPEHLTKAEFQSWQDEQQAAAQARANEQQFTTDLNELVGDRELDDKGDAWIKSRTHKNRGELEQSVNAWFEYLDQHAGGTKRRKKTTPPLAGGKTATGVPDYSDMTREQATEAMVERARALDTQM